MEPEDLVILALTIKEHAEAKRCSDEGKGNFGCQKFALWVMVDER